MSDTTPPGFEQMALQAPLLKAIKALGYEIPTAIQAQTIPLLLDGRDVLGQAQTGTGKTAAFALPLLSNLDPKLNAPQVLVLTPTRELAIQVAEAFKSYASQIKSFHILPVYGGQEYGTQTRALQRGVHVIVGTPGRVMDHMRRGNIKLDSLQALVLDEADEMLRMGFIDDVEWVLEQTPKKRQIALFSATIPSAIRRISKNYLNNPAEITIQVKTTTAPTIRQRYWPVSGTHKLDALTRILEAETIDAMLVFVRTKTASVEVAEKLEARGYRAVALNGDIAQNSRERIITQLKAGKLDILVATDVAARGLDVERISHVINYDIPHDTEAYVHRIGRTGRAGREGDAILFVAPREQRMLQAIENATRQKIELMHLPSTDMVNNRRIEKFKQRISDTLAQEDLGLFREMLSQFEQENGVEALDIAAALARLVQGNAPFLLSAKSADKPAQAFERADSARERKPRGDRKDRPPRDFDKPRGERKEQQARDHDKPRSERKERQPRDFDKPRSEHKEQQPRDFDKPRSEHKEQQPRDYDKPRGERKDRPPRDFDKPRRDPGEADNTPLEAGKDRFRIEVGRNHQVKPGNIVGAIANEANIDSKFIGRISIFDDYSLIDLPENMPKELLNALKPVRVAGQRLNISLFGAKKARQGGDKPLRARPKVRLQHKKDKGKPKRARKPG